MIAESTSKFGSSLATCAVLASLLGGCGVFVTQRDHDALVAKNEAAEKSSQAQVSALRADLDATRERLDNALRANADRGSDITNQKGKVNALSGKLEETSHLIEELRKEITSTRSELDARLDEIKRTQEAPKAPPVAIPVDKNGHFAALEAAHAAKDWPLTRTLGHAFIEKYVTDDRADDVLFLMGDADLKDGRPSSALGEFNRILKLTPPSNVLDKTLFAMGEAYLLMHDCENAKLAFSSCATRFPKDKLGAEAKARVTTIDKPAPGMCAPP
jgi:TolA-binding protein